ncbi:hypothetical protein [Corynebacterium canis]|uniref:hypothetical protein n=1 Tax=Corynebacterium canis TaxID=679663 RepID=UPI0025B306B5|nr:hypothetical protein [Corynebacterium canis]
MVDGIVAGLHTLEKGRRQPFDQLTRRENASQLPTRCTFAVSRVQMCLRQILRGRVSPG